MKIGCIVMAAGNARRFGSNKLDARVEGKTLLRRALEAVPAACFDRVAVVTQYPRGMDLAREMGFADVNMDVITGLPGEEMAQFEHTMDEIRRLAPDSLTVHTLAIKRSSRLNLEKYPLPDGDLTARMVRLGGETARALGMKPYYLYRQKYMAGQQQNVGYATAGNACLYNIDMMEETGSVIAVGAGAISKRVFPDRELRIERAPNVTNVAVYIDRVAEMARRKEHLFHS